MGFLWAPEALWVSRTQWDSSLLACLGRNDEFCSSDIEVCLLGSIAPCVLYGSNCERLGSSAVTFSNHCMPYSALYLLGNSLFGWNFLAPWFSYQSLSAIRRKFKLEGSCEALNRSCGCCGSCMAEDELQHEQCEQACDFATHMFCHAVGCLILGSMLSQPWLCFLQESRAWAVGHEITNIAYARETCIPS